MYACAANTTLSLFEKLADATISKITPATGQNQLGIAPLSLNVERRHPVNGSVIPRTAWRQNAMDSIARSAYSKELILLVIVAQIDGSTVFVCVYRNYR